MLAKTLLADTFSALLALGSFAFYLAGFFYPEVHRRTDLVWSGLGLLYAALLWFCAGQMTLAVLLAQLIVVALLLGLGWQTLSVRREKTPVYQQTPISITPEVVSDWTKNRLNQLRIAPKESVPVRLEKRASGQQLDPRRRPAYDYEFVEDGLVEMASVTNPITEATEALSEVLSLEVLPLDAESRGEIIVEVPPSVEAEIISVEEPAAEEPAATQQLTTDETAALSKIAGAADVVEPFVSTQALSEDFSDVAKDEPLSSAVVKEEEAAPLDEGWDDEIFSDTSIESTPIETIESTPFPLAEPAADSSTDSAADSFEPQPAQSPTAKSNLPPITAPREKPSLLATPVILVGWVKDVVTSLTRPKPSKPVIEIPRREPPGAIRNPTESATPTYKTPTAQMPTAQAPTSVSPATSTVPSTATPPAETDWSQKPAEASYAESGRAIAPEADNWEESNWDD